MPVNRSPELTRRELVVSSAVALTTAGLATAHVSAQTPGATPVLDSNALQVMSTVLVGGGQINVDALPILIELVSSDEALVAALPELSAVSPMTTESVAALGTDAKRLATNILQFWYLGRWNDQAIAQRADVYFSLVSWQALPYATQQTVCKAFGYWATDVSL